VRVEEKDTIDCTDQVISRENEGGDNTCHVDILKKKTNTRKDNVQQSSS